MTHMPPETHTPAAAGGTRSEPPSGPDRIARRYPIGAEIQGDGVHFRLWAPNARSVDVVVRAPNTDPDTRRSHALRLSAPGYFEGTVDCAAGDLYQFRLDGNDRLLPDPASRFQPEGPHGPSMVVDPSFPWTDDKWPGLRAKGQVVYEMHIGTFTGPGTWTAAAAELRELSRIGITTIELMPVAEFPGRFGWGYDGVALFAPYHHYGSPSDFRRFVDTAHAVGIGVVLDVVYNHIGPDGNYLGHFAKSYFTDRYRNDWGEAINFDGPDAGPVREFFLSNAAYWIEEFHIDGLRLDATQQIFDASSPHIIAEISRVTREHAGRRSIWIVAENEPQDTRIVRSADKGGYGLDAMWNDDFHHSARVALTSRSDAYYTDYRGSPQEFISALKWGFLYQGQYYKWQKQRRGTPSLDLPPETFVTFIENHDQLANSARGERCHEQASRGTLRAMTALLLLSPSTPMLFQGQEFAASAPFLYFADHREELAGLVAEGRREFLRQFPGLAQPDVQQMLAAPNAPETFMRCKLDFNDRERNAGMYRLHRDLLALRRDDPRFSIQPARGMDGAVLGDAAFVLRYFAESPGEERLLLVNLGRDLLFDPGAEPLLAPPPGIRWEILWSSEDPDYGGNGVLPLDADETWAIPGAAAVVLVPRLRS